MNQFVTPQAKINSNWIKELKVSPETITFLEENTGSMLFDVGLSDNFFVYVFLGKGNKRKKNKQDYIKLKRFVL